MAYQREPGLSGDKDLAAQPAEDNGFLVALVKFLAVIAFMAAVAAGLVQMFIL